MSHDTLLTTERCVLDVLQTCDCGSVLKLQTDSDVRRFLGGPVDEATFEARFLRLLKQEPGERRWVICGQKDNTFIGLVYLAPHHDGETEVSYELLSEWWGMGLAAEAVGAVIKFGLDKLKLVRVVAETQSANLKSRQILECLGTQVIGSVERFGARQVIYTTEC
jgi:ribosomal-protein-alanine N-acetyltransferase